MIKHINVKKVHASDVEALNLHIRHVLGETDCTETLSFGDFLNAICDMILSDDASSPELKYHARTKSSWIKQAVDIYYQYVDWGCKDD